mgnify:FL=1
MIAVVLAAGRGTRMGALTATTPKPMLPLAGQPILAHILHGLAGAGLEQVVLVVGYRGECIVEHFGNGRHMGLQLQYVWQEKPEGTAAALLLASGHIGSHPFFLTWGDVVVSPANYRALCERFLRQPCAGWIGINAVDDPAAGAAVYLDGERVCRMVEKPPPGTSRTRWNNAGLGIYQPLLLDYAAALPPSPRGERELPQAVQAMIAGGHEVRAYPIRGFWSDLGTPEALALAERTFDPNAEPE